MATAIFDFTGETAPTANILYASYAGGIGAVQFTIAASKSITSYKINISQEIIDSGSLDMYLATDSSDSIGTEIADTRKSLDAASVNVGIIEFTLAAAKTLSAGTYWVVAYSGGAGAWQTDAFSQSGCRAFGYGLPGQGYADDYGLRMGVWADEVSTGQFARPIAVYYQRLRG